MVAPYTNGRLTRSLVRVPGSGRFGNGISVYHDFSRVSTAAAMMAAQNPPPHLPMRPKQSRNNSTDFRKVASGSDSSTTEATRLAGGRPSTEVPLPSAQRDFVASATPNVASTHPETECEVSGTQFAEARGIKRHREETQQEGAGSLPTKAPRVTQTDVPQRPSIQETSGRQPTVRQGSHVVMVPAGPAFMVTNNVVQHLLEERNQLQMQNQALAQKLKAFQLLFRNKDKLTSVLRTLGLTVM